MCLFFRLYKLSGFVVEYQNGPAAQDHRTLSHRALLGQCRKAYPTEELLQDLYHFNFEAFLHYGVDYLTEELPLFFEWIKEQVCPDLKIPKDADLLNVPSSAAERTSISSTCTILTTTLKRVYLSIRKALIQIFYLQPSLFLSIQRLFLTFFRWLHVVWIPPTSVTLSEQTRMGLT